MISSAGGDSCGGTGTRLGTGFKLETKTNEARTEKKEGRRGRKFQDKTTLDKGHVFVVQYFKKSREKRESVGEASNI